VLVWCLCVDVQAVQQLHTQLTSLASVAEQDLCTPSVVTALPFLCLDEHIPERMQLHMLGAGQGPRCFRFMGRCKMAELLSNVRSLSNMTLRERAAERMAAEMAAGTAAVPSISDAPGESVFSDLLVYGTPGWGKSYMMAAAAVVLRQDFFSRRSCLRVVYLPDCGQLRRRPVTYMKNALLLAFADDMGFMQKIHACATEDQLVAFCDCVPKRNSFLLFIADQTNKLTAKNTDPHEKQQQKMTANSLLRSCAYAHFLVEAISINDSNKEEVQQKQENRKELPMFGELSEAEWVAWLTQHKKRLPLPEDGSQQAEVYSRIAVETGRNLLFLSPFIRPECIPSADWTWTAAWKAFLHLKEVSKIQRNLQNFVGALQADSYPSRRHALIFMTSAICKGPHLDMPNYYDARYFCVLDGIAHCVGQYVARCAASVIAAQRRLDLFRDSLWINTIRMHRDNPSVLGFLVEKAVLGYLANSEVLARLFQRADLGSQHVEVRTFKHGTETAALNSSAPVTLYIPEEFNYKSIDCVLRIIDRTQHKPIVQPTRKSKRVAGQARTHGTCGKKQKTGAASAATAAPSTSSSLAAAPAVSTSNDEDMAAAELSCSGEEHRHDGHSSGSVSAVAAGPVTNIPSTVVTLLPIQVTTASSISASKRKRSFEFFQRRAAWCADFQDDTRTQIRLQFAFIVRQCAMQMAVPSVPVDHEGDESFQLLFFALSSIDEQLDRAVDSPSIAATAAAAQPTSPPRLQLTTASGMSATVPAATAVVPP